MSPALLSVDLAVAVERMSDLIERSLAERHGEYIRLLHVVRTFALEQTEPAEIDGLRRAHAERMRDGRCHPSRRPPHSSDQRPDRRVPDAHRRLSPCDRRQPRRSTIPTPPSESWSRFGISAFNSASFELQRWAEDAAIVGDRVEHPAAVDGYAVASLAAWKRGSLDDMRRLLARAEAIVDRSGRAPTYELLGAQATEDLAHGALTQAIDRLALAGSAARCQR